MTNEYHLIPASEAGDTTPSNNDNFVSSTSVTNNTKGFLEAFEGYRNTAYADSRGIPTVGVGINLQNNRAYDQLYLTEDSINIKPSESRFRAIVKALGDTYTTTTSGKITTTATQKLQAALTIANGGNALPPLSDSDMNDLWSNVFLSTDSTSQYEMFYKTISSSRLNIDTSNLLNSLEGVALFSLSFNGALSKSPTLLGDLNQSSFNRADAWYQIRYGSNPRNSTGVAAR